VTDVASRRAARWPRSRGVSAERSPGRPPAPNRRRGPLFWSATAAGWALIAWGIRGALIHRIDTRPPQLLRFFVTGLAVHDALFAPAVLLAGVVLARSVPTRWRATVQAALLVAGTAALFSYPLVRGYAHILRNPTSLPRNYGAGLAIVVAVVVVAAVAGRLALAVTARRQTDRQRVAPSGPAAKPNKPGRISRWW
jgi:hypothetical protein